jgi:hypothetical protein
MRFLLGPRRYVFLRIRSPTDDFVVAYDGTADLPRHVVWFEQDPQTFEKVCCLQIDRGLRRQRLPNRNVLMDGLN